MFTLSYNVKERQTVSSRVRGSYVTVVEAITKVSETKNICLSLASLINRLPNYQINISN